MKKSKLVTLAGEEQKVELAKGVYASPKTAAVMANYFKKKAAERGEQISAADAINLVKQSAAGSTAPEAAAAIGSYSRNRGISTQNLLIASAVGLSIVVFILKKADKKKGRK